MWLKRRGRRDRGGRLGGSGENWWRGRGRSRAGRDAHVYLGAPRSGPGEGVAEGAGVHWLVCAPAPPSPPGGLSWTPAGVNCNLPASHLAPLHSVQMHPSCLSCLPPPIIQCLPTSARDDYHIRHGLSTLLRSPSFCPAPGANPPPLQPLFPHSLSHATPSPPPTPNTPPSLPHSLRYPHPPPTH